MGRPIRILLVSDDDEFGGRMLVRAARRGVTMSLVGSGENLDVAAVGYGANVVVLDADEAPRRRTRAATAFASTHRMFLSCSLLRVPPRRASPAYPSSARSRRTRSCAPSAVSRTASERPGTFNF
jgi:hypothetical protein